jgi:hypothetical protein
VFRELLGIGLGVTKAVVKKAINYDSGSYSEHVKSHHVPVSGALPGSSLDNGLSNLASDAIHVAHRTASGVKGAIKDSIKGSLGM